MYKIKFTKTALKNLKKIEKRDQLKIIVQIEKLAESPHDKSNIKKLVDSPFWRLRVGSYRNIYDKEDTVKIIDIINVLHR